MKDNSYLNDSLFQTVTKSKFSPVYLFIRLCYLIYKFIKYILLAFAWPFILIALLFVKIQTSIYHKRKEKLQKKTQQEVAANNQIIQQELDPVIQEVKSEEYINKEKIKKRNFGDYINLGLQAFVDIFGNTKKWWSNLSFVKQRNNEKMMKSTATLVNFGKQNEHTLQKKVAWEYIAYDTDGKKVKGYIDAYSRVEVQSFLLGEGLNPYSIRTNKTIQTLHGSLGSSKAKIKNKDLIFLLTQLSTYLKSGITLVESLNILIRQTKKKTVKNVLREVTHELTMGESLSRSMEKQGKAFPRLLINMVKASELTGELPETLDDMTDYYTQVEAARKEMVSALTYPTIVFIFTIAVITFVLVYVVPQFVDIYSSMDSSEVPAFTKAVITVSDFLKANYLLIIGIMLAVILLLAYLYKYVTLMRTLFQWIVMHIPILGNIIIYNEVSMFARTFCSLLSHNVFITDSMDILNKITNNEIYKMMILDTVSNLAKGDKISKAFKDQWAFPIPAYEMIVTGEKTGQLAEMMGRVAAYYQDLHKNTVSRIKALVEPILIIMLTFAVGVILLAIIVPMFNMYQQVQNMG